MTYAMTSAGLWVNRANQAWGSSRQYNVGSSFEQDAANNAANAATWQGRANNAWGDSRVWNSGTSFETNRNAAYASGVWGSGPTWQANANNAWGASRVYGSGESWEAAYNRVLPPAAVDHLFTSGYSPSNNTPTTVLTLTLDRVGQWLLVASVDCLNSSGQGNAQSNCRLYFNGVQQGPQASTDVPSNQNNWNPHNVRLGPPPALVTTTNTTSQVTVQSWAGDNNSNPRNIQTFLDCYFIPIQSTPH